MADPIYSPEFTEDMHALHVADFYLKKLFRVVTCTLYERPGNWVQFSGSQSDCVFFQVLCNDTAVKNLRGNNQTVYQFTNAFTVFAAQRLGLNEPLSDLEKRFGFSVASLFICSRVTATGIEIYCPVKLTSLARTRSDKRIFIQRYTQHYSDYLCPAFSSTCTDCGQPIQLKNSPKGKTVTVTCKACHRPNYLYIPLNFTASAPPPPVANANMPQGNIDFSIFFGNKPATPPAPASTQYANNMNSYNVGAVSTPTAVSAGAQRELHIMRPKHGHRDLLAEGAAAKVAAFRNIVKDAAKIHAFLDDRDCGVIPNDDWLKIPMNSTTHSLKCGKVGKTFVIPAGQSSYQAFFFNNQLSIAPADDPFLEALTRYMLKLFRGRGICDRMDDPNNQYQSIRVRYSETEIVLFWTPVKTKGLKQWASGYVEENVTYASMGITASPPGPNIIPENANYWSFVEAYIDDALTEDDEADVEKGEFGFTHKTMHRL